jgi:hypothetical protein
MSDLQIYMVCFTLCLSGFIVGVLATNYINKR